MKLKISLAALIIFILISGCTSTPSYHYVGYEEAFSYERKYLNEYYQSLKHDKSNKTIVKWIQPLNKKQPCKVFMAISKDKYRTLAEDYKIYWDGDCKNGYAHGLGREIERGMILNRDSIAIYNGKRQKPQYFVQSDHLENTTIEGNSKDEYYVFTHIKEGKLDIEIDHFIGYFPDNKNAKLFIAKSPFLDGFILSKKYPNFSYEFIDMSNDEFEETINYGFEMKYEGKQNGFGYVMTKSGELFSGESLNGKLGRRVKLPIAYLEKIEQIRMEILEASRKAIKAQEYASKVKKQYMNKVCKQSLSVDFMDNDEYKQICNESDYYEKLKGKIDAKLAEINRVKQQKRVELNQQKLLNAKEAQARQNARNTSYLDTINTMQLLNNTILLQQLNNRRLLGSGY